MFPWEWWQWLPRCCSIQLSTHQRVRIFSYHQHTRFCTRRIRTATLNSTRTALGRGRHAAIFATGRGERGFHSTATETHALSPVSVGQVMMSAHTYQLTAREPGVLATLIADVNGSRSRRLLSVEQTAHQSQVAHQEKIRAHMTWTASCAGARAPTRVRLPLSGMVQ